MADLQPYVLRSWEKEFPGIGVQQTVDGPRFYRQADVDQVLKIKQLVFGEGLTVGGARRRMEDAGPPKVTAAEAAEVLSTLGAGARNKVATVREGLKAIQAMLAHKPGEFVLEPPSVRAKTTKGKAKPPAKSVADSRRSPKPAVAARKSADAKRRRASA